MKFINKIKNKYNTFKNEIKHENCLDYNNWLSINGYTDNAENRGAYASYKLKVDEINKKADMRLSQVIGRFVFLAIFLTIFIIACANSIGATFVVGDNYQNIPSMSGSISSAVITVPYDNGNKTYSLYYQHFYTYDRVNDFRSFAVDNVDYFIEDITIYYDSIPNQPNLFTDLNILTYLREKYPSVDFSSLSFMEFGTTTLFVSLYHNSFMTINNYINQGYGDGFTEGYNEGLDVGYTNGYTNGYNEGLDTGYTNGYNEGLDTGLNDGLNYGYQDGYQDGLADGEIAKKSIFAIFDAPIKVLTSLLDFEIFGINLLAIFKVILTILLLGAIAKFVLSIAL